MTFLEKFRHLAIAAVIAAPLSAQAQDMADVEITTEDLGGGIYVLFGRGGNIGVSVGGDGIILVDDQYAPLTDKVVAAIRDISDAEMRFLLNTHYHGDHTGGNENLGHMGVTIVAHDNIHERLSGKLGDGDAQPAVALPVITFNDQLSFRINGDDARAIHVAHAHTDGDSMIYFKNANVIHMGDLLFNGRYPYIDVDGGGTVDGYIAAQERGLAVGNAETTYIAGHGPTTDADGVRANLAMIRTVRNRVAALKSTGASLEDVLAAAPSADYSQTYAWGFINDERFVTSVYKSLP